MPSETDSSNSNPVVFLLGLLAVGGAAVFGVARTKSDSPSPKHPVQIAKNDPDARPAQADDSFEPLDVLHDFLRVTAKPSDDSSKLNAKITLREEDATWSVSLEAKRGTRKPEDLADALKIEPATYEFLIVTVPNPVESKFSQEFDATVESIQRAYEARGFTLRVSRLPWPHGPAGQGANVETGRVHRDHPGVLLFQCAGKNRNSITLALVCLVAESPISGISKVALTNALTARERLLDAMTRAGLDEFQDCGGLTSCEPVRLIAPYFSGSQSSLILALREWKESDRNRTELQIITGSATALDPEGFGQIRDFLPNCSLRSTVIPNKLLMLGIFSYLAGNRSPTPDACRAVVQERVAILRESNTGFGMSSVQDRRKQTDRDRSSNCDDENPGGSSNDSPSGSSVSQPWIDFPFPMAIHRLQAELDKSPVTTPVLPQTDFVEPKVSNTNRIDAIPPYDPESAVSSAGQCMRAILATIKRDDIRYVGIVATDIRDVVVLNRLLRKECSNVRVFTTEPAAALLQPEDAAQLRGMLVASTYPLDLVIQEWSQKSSDLPLIPFSTQASQGYYNAILAHYGQSERMVGYGLPRLPNRSQHSFPPTSIPPIWISVVGEGGRLLPVHCFTDYNDTYAIGDAYYPLLERVTDASSRHPDQSVDVPAICVPVVALLAALAAIVVLFLALCAVCVDQSWEKWGAGLTRREIPGPGTNGKFRVQTSFWLEFWRGGMLCGMLLFVLPYSLPAWEARGLRVFSGLSSPLRAFIAGPCSLDGLDWRQSSLILMAVLINLLILIMLAAMVAKSIDPPPGRNRWWFGGLAMVVLVTWIGTHVWWIRREPIEQLFIYLRITEVAAGLSPLVPMGILAWTAIALSWCCLKQARLSRETLLMCPYPSTWKDVCDADLGLNQELCSHIRFLVNRRTMVLLLGLGIPFALCLIWTAGIIPLPSEEGLAWDRLMRAVFCSLAVAILLILVRFLSVWHRLSELMKEIQRIPMVAAFERLPGGITRLFGGYLYSEQRTYHSHLAAAAWALPIEQRRELRTWIRQSRHVGLSWVFRQPVPTPEMNESTHTDEQDRETANFPDSSQATQDLQDQIDLAERLREHAVRFLNEMPQAWHRQSMDAAFGTDRPQKNEITRDAISDDSKRENSGSSESALLGNQAYVAAYVVLYLGSYFAQLRMLVYAVVIAAPLLLFAGASYPFQPDRPQLTGLIALLAMVAVGTTYLLYKINKDGLISRITRTTPNRFTPDWGFFSSIANFVLPLLGLVLLHMLGLIRFIVEPVLGLFQ